MWGNAISEWWARRSGSLNGDRRDYEARYGICRLISATCGVIAATCATIAGIVVLTGLTYAESIEAKNAVSCDVRCRTAKRPHLYNDSVIHFR